MRLGRYFDRYKVPQWAAHYIDYNAHKRTLKFVSHDVDATRAESVLSGQFKLSLSLPTIFSALYYITYITCNPDGTRFR